MDPRKKILKNPVKNTGLSAKRGNLCTVVLRNHWRRVVLVSFNLIVALKSAEAFYLMMIRRIIILTHREGAGLTEVVQAFVKVSILCSSSSNTTPVRYSAQQIKVFYCANSLLQTFAVNQTVGTNGKMLLCIEII